MLAFESRDLKTLMKELGGESLAGSGFDAEESETDFDTEDGRGEE